MLLLKQINRINVNNIKVKSANNDALIGFYRLSTEFSFEINSNQLNANKNDPNQFDQKIFELK